MQAARIWSSCRCPFPQYRRAASSTGSRHPSRSSWSRRLSSPPAAAAAAAAGQRSSGGRAGRADSGSPCPVPPCARHRAIRPRAPPHTLLARACARLRGPRSRGGAAQQRGASGAGRADSGSPCPVPPCARHRAIRPRAPPHTLLARACARLRGPPPRVFPPLSHRHRHHAHHPPDTPCPPAVPPSGRAACPGRNPRPPPSSRLLLPTPRPVSRPASAAAAAAGQRSSGGRAGSSGQRLPEPGSPVHAKSPPAPARPPANFGRAMYIFLCFFFIFYRPSKMVPHGPKPGCTGCPHGPDCPGVVVPVLVFPHERSSMHTFCTSMHTFCTPFHRSGPRGSPLLGPTRGACRQHRILVVNGVRTSKRWACDDR